MDVGIPIGFTWVLTTHIYAPQTPSGPEAGAVWADFGSSVVWWPSELVLERYDGGGCVALRTVGTIAPTGLGDSAGALTVSGLRADVGGAVTVQPWCPAPSYFCSYWVSAVSALFDSGSTVTVTAPGDDFPGFSLSAPAPAPLVLISPNPADAFAASDIGVVPGLPFSVSWEPAGGDRIWVALATPDAPVAGRIECTVDDTGVLVIPAEATALLADLEPVSVFAVQRHALAVTGNVELGVGYREGVELP